MTLTRDGANLMSKVVIAFYKHKRERNSVKNTLFRFFDDAIKFFTHGPYSHCEIAIPNPDPSLVFTCYSASNRDGGVRKKVMQLPLERWDLVELKISPKEVNVFFEKTKGLKYDLIGALGVVLRIRDSKTKYFCSEWCAECLGIEKSYRFSPNSLYKHLTNSHG